jgi:hypothetical protein
MTTLRLIDLLRKSPAPAGFFYMSSRWILDGVRVAGISEAISMESLGAGVRTLSPTTIRAAGAFLAVAADARNGSFPGGELLGVDPEVSRGSPARRPGRGWQTLVARAVGERLGGGVELLACDVGIAAHGREV